MIRTTRTTRMILGTVSAAAILGLGAAPASAGHFTELSKFHNVLGVSQFNAIDLGVKTDMLLYNPNHVTQIAAALLYERSQIDYRWNFDKNEELDFFASEDFPLEIYLGCIVARLTPHAALELNWPGLSGVDDYYVEVIFVPEQPVRVAIAALGGEKKNRRMADGLGGQTAGDDQSDARGYHLVHPSAFSLPDDTVTYVFDNTINQQEGARRCVCQGIFDLVDEPFKTSVSTGVFKPFGINCP